MENVEDGTAPLPRQLTGRVRRRRHWSNRRPKYPRVDVPALRPHLAGGDHTRRECVGCALWAREAFLEELIVRRELAHNYVWSEPDYDTFPTVEEMIRGFCVSKGLHRDEDQPTLEFEEAPTKELLKKHKEIIDSYKARKATRIVLEQLSISGALSTVGGAPRDEGGFLNIGGSFHRLGVVAGDQCAIVRDWPEYECLSTPRGYPPAANRKPPINRR